MSDKNGPPIVIKKKGRAHHDHHGGAWKIAYADFVTAMMAFFLLMWLLGSTTEAQRRGISEYFQAPLKVALLGGEGSGQATSLVKGGGEDLTKSVGEDSRKNEMGREEKEKSALQELKAKLQGAIDSKSTLRQSKKQILLDITGEGLRIQIVDDQNRPMFASGSSRMESYTSPILREIGGLLNDVKNNISLAGHTDATPYAGGELGYSNWELSADRANASRRELVAGGMEESKILRVVGLGSALPFDKANPYNPMNRRISIIVMNRKTEQAIRNEAGGSQIANDAEGMSRALEQSEKSGSQGGQSR